jgi:hypothetical protein
VDGRELFLALAWCESQTVRACAGTGQELSHKSSLQLGSQVCVQATLRGAHPRRLVQSPFYSPGILPPGD